MTFEKIISHNDFDGIVSAAICSYVFKIDQIQFAGPNNIANAELLITKNDIVCDLPYPLECGLWFDHHAGNLQELNYRNIDPATIPGNFDTQPSCARVVYNYFIEHQNLPDYFINLVEETDRIDSFDFKSIEDWRQETPAKIIDSTIKVRWNSYKEKIHYLKQQALWLRDFPIKIIAQKPEVIEKYHQYISEEKEVLKIIENNSFFLQQDKNTEIVILDLSNFNRPPYMIKNLAYLIFPNALSVLEVKPIFKNRIKSNDLSFSLSLSIKLNDKDHNKDASEIMRELNIGDGHPGAAAGTVRCTSKNEMLKQKTKMQNEILKIWQEQK